MTKLCNSAQKVQIQIVWLYKITLNEALYKPCTKLGILNISVIIYHYYYVVYIYLHTYIYTHMYIYTNI